MEIYVCPVIYNKTVREARVAVRVPVRVADHKLRHLCNKLGCWTVPIPVQGIIGADSVSVNTSRLG